jgi:hypothetical protein
VAAMNTIQAKRQKLGEARIAVREALAHQQRLEAQVAAAERWHYPNSVEVLEARKRLLRANGEVASARVRLQRAERDAGIWGEG